MRQFSVFLVLLLSFGIIQAQDSLYDLPDPFLDPVSISSNIALTRAGRILSSNPFVNRVSIIGLERNLDAEFDIGLNPNAVAIVPDNLRGLALSEEALVVIDFEENAISATYPLEGKPFGLVTTVDTAYVSLQEANEVIAINLDDGNILARIPTPSAPSGLALWGDFLYVTHFWTGELSLIYLPLGEVVRTIQTTPNASLSASIEINPIHGLAYLPQSLSNTSATRAENRSSSMIYEIDLSNMSVLRGINLGEALDGAAALPYAVRQPSNRSRLYISLSGNNGIVVLNLDTGEVANFVETGLAPRGLIFSSNYGLLYVQDALDGTVSIFDTRFFGLEDQIPNSQTSLSAQEQIAGRLFYLADSRLSPSGTQTCATCHWQGQSDGREWLEVLTPPLFRGEVEGEWLNVHIETMMGGEGLELESIDMDALLAYLQRE